MAVQTNSGMSAFTIGQGISRDDCSKLVLDSIKKYRCLPAAMMPYLLHLPGMGKEKNKNMTFRAVNWLKDNHTIVQDDSYLKIYHKCNPDRKLITALWVMLTQFPDIPLDRHGLGDEPAQLFLNVDGSCIDICCFDKTEEFKARNLDPIDDTQRYIFVLLDESQINTVQKFAPQYPTLFAIPEFGKNGITCPPKNVIRKAMRTSSPGGNESSQKRELNPKPRKSGVIRVGR